MGFLWYIENVPPVLKLGTYKRTPILCIIWGVLGWLKIMPPIIKEADIQIACNDYLILLSKKYNFRHFHVPNEGKRSIWLHNRMKRMGLKSGCPDIIIEYPEGRILYVELKTKKGRLSEAQKLWAVQSKALGTPHFIVQGGLNECIEQLRGIIEKHIPIRW